jgi:hypothetical protein
MKRILYGALALLCILLVSGCIGQNQSSTLTNSTAYAASGNISDVQKIEVLHFHGTHQCSSCIAVGDYAEETVNTYFSEEVKSGKIVFAHINGDLPENSEMVAKYEVTGSSLWIGVYDKNGFHKEENINVWYKIGNKAEYMNYLKGIIEKRFNGEM